MTLQELKAVFDNVYSALRSDGLFLFDLNTEITYQMLWDDSFSIVGEDHICVVRLSHLREQRIGKSDITIFRWNSGWQRTDLTLMQRYYTNEEVHLALQSSGFLDVRVYDVHRDLEQHPNDGRVLFLCRHPHM